MNNKVKENRVYSESFKQQVLLEISKGKTITELRRMYDIRGAGTIYKWIEKYGREDLIAKRVRIETMDERNELKEARKRIRDLEAALADAHIDNCLEHAFLEIACERMDTPLDDFKKKNALTLSDVRKMRGRS